MGIQPDVLICRSEVPLEEGLRRKIAGFTNVEFENVITAYDVKTIYEVPLHFYEQGLDAALLKRMSVESRHADLRRWNEMIERFRNPSGSVRIGVVGKYMELHDAYKSVWESLYHAGAANDARVEIVAIDSSKLEADGADLDALLGAVDGILVPGGFGQRGIEGMVSAARWAREKGTPYFGICLGMQIMVIEYARDVIGWADAVSSEFDEASAHAVVSLLEEQVDVKNYGGTMRLGRSESRLKQGTRIRAAYGSDVIFERHRHRYEVSNQFRGDLEKAGLIVSGLTPDGSLVESVEWPDHPWGIGVQFHPEFKSRPIQAHPLFSGFVAAALAGKKR